MAATTVQPNGSRLAWLASSPRLADLPGDVPVAVYGTGAAGRNFVAALARLRPDIAVPCYLDSTAAGTLDGREVLTVKAFLDSPRRGWLVVVASAFWPEMIANLIDRDFLDFLVLDQDLVRTPELPETFVRQSPFRSGAEHLREVARRANARFDFTLAGECLRLSLDRAGEHPSSLLASVILLVTLRCNLRCAHCWGNDKESFLDASTREMTTTQVMAVLTSLARLTPRPLLLLSGGEVFVRRDIEAIVRHAAGQGLKLVLFTNGTYAARLKRLVADPDVRAGLLCVAVSLDGPQAVHDAIRGPGVFRQAMRTLDVLREAGVKADVNTIVQRGNIHAIEEVWELRRQLQRSHDVAMNGFSVELLGADYIPIDDLERITPFISSDMAGLLRHRARFSGLGCTAATAKCTIRSDGEVLACAISEAVRGGRAISLGNLGAYDHDLAALLDSPDAARARAEVLACPGCASYCER
jgi:MoaA/NifB/PqqE/SkfB family radical SAM enzyme